MSEVSKRDRQKERERRGKCNFLTVIPEKINAKDNSLVFPVVLGCFESCLSSQDCAFSVRKRVQLLLEELSFIRTTYFVKNTRINFLAFIQSPSEISKQRQGYGCKP